MSRGTDARLARIRNGLRWVLFLPAALGAGFLVGGLVHGLSTGSAGFAGGALAYAAAFASGLAYVWAVLHTASAIVPSHERIVVAVLGVLVLGDLAFVHLVLPDLQAAAPPTGEAGLDVLLRVLRAGDHADLRNGPLVKIVGAFAGGCLAWRRFVKRGRTAKGDSVTALAR